LPEERVTARWVVAATDRVVTHTRAHELDGAAAPQLGEANGGTAAATAAARSVAIASARVPQRFFR
jgi:hypothetical protein